MSKTVAIVGAGNMGTALGQVIAANGHRAYLWSIEADVLEEIRDRRLNSKYLEGVPLHERIEARWRLEEALADAWLAVFTVPSQVVRLVARDAAPFLKPGQVILNVAKGLEKGSHLRMSQVLAQELPQRLHRGIASMGGPAIAAELARGVPTAVVVAATDIAIPAAIRETFENEHFKVETTTDLCGVELGAALKNVYALALGMCDGAGYGTNTKALLVPVALAEMAHLSQALGGQLPTLYGLAGLGDLITTGFNPRSHNRTLGEKLGSRADWRAFLETDTVEGVPATRAVKELSATLDLKMPLLDAVFAILFQGAAPKETLRAFLANLIFA